MVVCKFFQQGSCRYGQSCRFEHIYGSKYSYHAPQHTPVQAPATSSAVTDEYLVQQVQPDILSAVRGNQWLLSSYAPFRDKPALPGLQDLSFEEARLFIYEAKAANNVDQAVAFMNNLFQDAKLKHEMLLQPTPNMMKALRSLYNGEIPASPFDNIQSNQFGTSSNANATSLFRSAVQSSGPSIFGQNSDNAAAKSLFAQAAQSNVFGNTQPTQNTFGAPSQTNSIFGSPTHNNQNVFGSPTQNVFDTNSAAKSIFAQANQNTFSNQVQSNPASLFATANQQISDPFAQKSSPFQTSTQPSSVFGGANVFEQLSDDGMTYSNLEQLVQEDIEAFQSESFQLGFVPEVPPPRALCI